MHDPCAPENATPHLHLLQIWSAEGEKRRPHKLPRFALGLPRFRQIQSDGFSPLPSEQQIDIVQPWGRMNLVANRKCRVSARRRDRGKCYDNSISISVLAAHRLCVQCGSIRVFSSALEHHTPRAVSDRTACQTGILLWDRVARELRRARGSRCVVLACRACLHVLTVDHATINKPRSCALIPRVQFQTWPHQWPSARREDETRARAPRPATAVHGLKAGMIRTSEPDLGGWMDGWVHGWMGV